MAESVVPAQVVLLNGVSSSGKSTVARQLLLDFESPWFHMGVDRDCPQFG
jgi:chloramphenicol 3-O phosphotransferase